MSKLFNMPPADFLACVLQAELRHRGEVEVRLPVADVEAFGHDPTRAVTIMREGDQLVIRLCTGEEARRTMLAVQAEAAKKNAHSARVVQIAGNA